MWLKYILAVVVSFILSSSLVVNLNFLLPVATDTALFIGLLTGFTGWAAIMVYFVSFNKISSALLHSGKWLIPSILLNVALIMMGN